MVDFYFYGHSSFKKCEYDSMFLSRGELEIKQYSRSNNNYMKVWNK